MNKHDISMASASPRILPGGHFFPKKYPLLMGDIGGNRILEAVLYRFVRDSEPCDFKKEYCRVNASSHRSAGAYFVFAKKNELLRDIPRFVQTADLVFLCFIVGVHIVDVEEVKLRTCG